MIPDLGYMIVVKNNPVSEYYASITLPEWKRLGFKIEVFDAYTSDRQPDNFKLNFQPLTSYKYVIRNIKKIATPTEQGCWNSHAALWLKCIELDHPILILEHDCYPTRPEHIAFNPKHCFVTYDSVGSGCYLITPMFAKLLWDVIKERGKIDHGPCGFIDYVKKKFALTNMIAWNVKNIVYPCHQIHSHEMGSTIKHYKETEAEIFANDFGTTTRVIIKNNQQPSIEDIEDIMIGK